MTPELTALTLAALLQVVQFALMAIPANRELGPEITASPRDGAPLTEQLSPKTARLHRALSNHFEGLILFSIACLVITFSDQGSKFTALCAITYLVARVLYIPAYYYGLTPWRSIIWAAGFSATTAMLVSALL